MTMSVKMWNDSGILKCLNTFLYEHFNYVIKKFITDDIYEKSYSSKAVEATNKAIITEKSITVEILENCARGSDRDGEHTIL